MDVSDGSDSFLILHWYISEWSKDVYMMKVKD